MPRLLTLTRYSLRYGLAYAWCWRAHRWTALLAASSGERPDEVLGQRIACLILDPAGYDRLVLPVGRQEPRGIRRIRVERGGPAGVLEPTETRKPPSDPILTGSGPLIGVPPDLRSASAGALRWCRAISPCRSRRKHCLASRRRSPCRGAKYPRSLPHVTNTSYPLGERGARCPETGWGSRAI